MKDDGKTDSLTESLAVPTKKQLQRTESLIKRGLQALTPGVDPTTINWENATLRGRCYKARKHYGPKEFPGAKRFFFVCEMKNDTQSRQAPTGPLRIFLRSRNKGGLSEAPDASLVMLYRGETKYRSIDLVPGDWTLARLEFSRTFPVSRPTRECQEEIFGDTGEIVVHDADGKVTIVLNV